MVCADFVVVAACFTVAVVAGVCFVAALAFSVVLGVV